MASIMPSEMMQHQTGDEDGSSPYKLVEVLDTLRARDGATDGAYIVAVGRKS